MSLNWEERFRTQLKWTKELRFYLYNKISLSKIKGDLLEIGCGTGELLKEIGLNYPITLHGIDIDEERVNSTKKNLKSHDIKADIKKMDILDNSFPEERFDIIITNYLFLWIKDLETCFEQIYRILKKKGFLLIFGEPDYGGLIEHPKSGLRGAIIANLLNLRADAKVGRKLNTYFSEKFKVVESFCSSIPWTAIDNREGLLREVEFFRELLKEENYDWKKAKDDIINEKYFLFIPIFSFHLIKEEYV